MCAPAPDVGSSVITHDFLHICSDTKVFDTRGPPLEPLEGIAYTAVVAIKRSKTICDRLLTLARSAVIRHEYPSMKP